MPVKKLKAVSAISEAEFRQQVLELARLRGWMVHYERPARTKDGWCTPISGDAGFPDIVMAKPGRGTLFVELKTDKGRVRPEQEKWQATLNNSGSVSLLWRPRDWEHIVGILGGD